MPWITHIIPVIISLLLQVVFIIAITDLNQYPMTSKDRNIIKECVKRDPSNLSEAFRIASIITGLKQTVITNYYYRVLRFEAPMFTLKGDLSFINTKNRSSIIVDIDDNQLNWLASLILSLSKPQKKKLIEILKK